RAPTSTAAAKRLRERTVLLATSNHELEPLLRRAGLVVSTVRFTLFDAAAAAAVEHFETYNRTSASRRVSDLVDALARDPGAALVADGDAALAALLAVSIWPVERAVLDVGAFDSSSDASFLERLYIPGLRRAGDL